MEGTQQTQRILLQTNKMEYSANFKKQLHIYFSVFISVVLFDQIPKRTLIHEIGVKNTKEFVPGIINFSSVKNTGGAFSIFKEYPVCFMIIGIINVFIFLYLTFCPTVPFNTITKAGCACILGGTLGNLIDRLLAGGVIDFLDLQLFNFAVFNLADVFIDIGVALILIGWFFVKEK